MAHDVHIIQKIEKEIKNFKKIFLINDKYLS